MIVMLTDKQIEFLKSLGLDLDYANLTEDSDEWADIEERVGDELEYRGLNNDYYPNEIGRMCESILDIIP
nr:MAG TPA: hypothetical protein [Caudoviricetes sp.]